MKRILVPTDFSDTAAGAYYYAQELARFFNASIHVLHVYHPSFDPAAPTFTGEAELMSIKREGLDNFVKNKKLPLKEGETALSITSEMTIGFAVDEIVAFSKKEEVDFIIMGATGEGGLADKLFGSISSSVGRKAHCPVLLVPNGVVYNPIEKILFSSNFESVEDDMIRELFNFAAPFHASVHFVHVSEGDEGDDKALQREIFEEVFEQKTTIPSFETCVVYHSSISEGINQYALDHEVDIIAAVTHKRSFWESLLHKSTTKELALTTSLPLLVLHWRDDD